MATTNGWPLLPFPTFLGSTNERANESRVFTIQRAMVLFLQKWSCYIHWTRASQQVSAHRYYWCCESPRSFHVDIRGWKKEAMDFVCMSSKTGSVFCVFEFRWRRRMSATYLTAAWTLLHLHYSWMRKSDIHLSWMMSMFLGISRRWRQYAVLRYL